MCRLSPVTIDGSRIFLITEESTLKILDSDGTSEIENQTGGHQPVAMAVTPDGCHVVSVETIGCLDVWNLENSILNKSLTSHRTGLSWVGDVSVTPDGSRGIYVSRDDMLLVRDLANGNFITKFKGDNIFSSCAVSPDALTVVAGDQAGWVYFFRLEATGS